MSASTASRNYAIVEPHPHIPASQHYISTGRGGAGNQIKTNPSNLTRGSDASGPASRISVPSSKPSSSSPRKYSTSGRGGAGNVFPSSERAIFSFDEELERQLRWERDIAPVYHVGRGGAGNFAHSSSNSHYSMSTGGKTSIGARRPSEDSAISGWSASSNGSESGADAFNRGVKKQWKKFTGMGN